MNISPEQFVKLLENQSAEVQKLMEGIPAIVGVEAVNHFKENFQNEGFTDVANQSWQEVKRRINSKRPDHAAASRPILTGDTGDLGRSIQKEVLPEQVIVFSDLPYADAHNKGTTNAGRNRDVTIPKRQFIGESEALNNKIEKEINERLKLILSE